MLNNRLKSEIESYFIDFGNDRILSVSATMKQCIWIEGFRFSLDFIAAQQNNRHFLKLLNRKVFGKSAQRYSKSVRVIPVVERSSSDRIHYHFAVQIPDHLDEMEFEQLIIECWKKTNWGHRNIDVRAQKSVGWLRYIAKLKYDCEVDYESMRK